MALSKSDKWLIAAVAVVFFFGTAVLTGGFLLYRFLQKSFAPPAAVQGEGPPLEWERTFKRGDTGRGELVNQTADGGFIVAAAVWEGVTDEEEGTMKVHLLKTGGDGSLDREAILEGEGPDELVTVEEGAQGGYFMLANRMEELEIDLFESTAETGEEREPVVGKRRFPFASLMKTDDRGKLEWEKAVGHGRRCRAGAGRRTGDGGCVIFGPIEEVEGRAGFYLLKVDPAGEVVWERALVPVPDPAEDSSDTMRCTGFSLTPSAEGGYICTAAHPLEESMVFSIFKTDESGNTLERSSFYLEGSFPGCFAADSSPGGGFIAGTNEEFSIINLFNPTIRLLKIDGSGSLQWEREYRRAGNINSIAPLGDGGCLVLTSGLIFFPHPSSDLRLFRIGPSGDLIWKRTFASALDETFESGYCADQARQTGTGGLIITGEKDGEILLLKVASEKQ